MPDMTPVATQIQAPNPMSGINTLSGMVGLQQQQQNLQTGQYQQATAQADSQQAQQKNSELSKAQSIAINGAKSGAYDDGQGGINRQKMADDILKVAPVYGQSQVSSLLSQANEVVANKAAHQSLTVAQKKEMGDTFASLAADPQVDNTKFIDAVEKLRQAHNNDPDFSRMLTSMTTHYPGTAPADQQRSVLGRWSAAATGEPQSAPSTVDTGTQIQPGATNKFGGGFTPAGPPINKQSVVATPAGPLGVATPARGTVSPLTTTGAPGAAPTGAPPQNLNTTHAQQTNATAMAGDDATRYSQISQEGSNAKTGAELADQVGQLAEQVRTGKLSKEWTDQLAVLAQHDPGITARQMLSKYAAQLKTMATSGATTDASRSQIDAGMPSPETMDPDAVKEASQYVGGIFRMRGARQAYADQYAKNSGSSMGIRGADDSFMRSADPTVFTYNSLPAGPERQKFLSSRFGGDPAKIREFIGRSNQVKHYAGSIE